MRLINLLIYFNQLILLIVVPGLKPLIMFDSPSVPLKLGFYLLLLEILITDLVSMQVWISIVE